MDKLKTIFSKLVLSFIFIFFFNSCTKENPIEPQKVGVINFVASINPLTESSL